jgi:nucleoside-diphosphate-sugar epimerase
MKILVTGATGFVGRAVLARIASDAKREVRAVVRHRLSESPARAEQVPIGDLSSNPDWGAAVHGVDAIVHTAARVHVIRDNDPDRLSVFRRVNVDATLTLARQAAEAGVSRFIFLSSIKVNGEETLPGHPFQPDGATDPRDAYAISKLEAESGLQRISTRSRMQVVILRSPLVYGPGVKANFLSMMTWLRRGIPLPFGGVTANRRSLVALENLVDLIATCVDHPVAGNQTFLVSDGEDLSTAELLIRLGKALQQPARLIRIPPSVLASAAVLVGRSEIARRLLGSLQADISKTRDLLGWVPPVAVDEALRRTADDFRRETAG